MSLIRPAFALIFHTIQSRLFSKQTFVLCCFVLLSAGAIKFVNLSNNPEPWKVWEEYSQEGGQHLLFVLSAILYSGVVLRDEFDNRTITYLFLRPVPKWLIGLCKVVGATLLSGVPLLFYLVLHSLVMKISLFPFLFPLMLEQFFFCSFFCLASLLFRHPILWSIIFTIMLPPDLPGALKLFSILYHQENLYKEVFRNLEVAPLTNKLTQKEVSEEEFKLLDQGVFSKSLYTTLAGSLRNEKKSFYQKTMVTPRTLGEEWLVTDEVTQNQFLLRRSSQTLYFYNTIYQDPNTYFPEISWRIIFYGILVCLLGIVLLLQFREFKLGTTATNK